MTQRRVEVTSDAFYGCMMHALSTESEEVMGLLVGDVHGDTVRISVILPLRRMDKRKDRVEPRPEQLSAAAEQADCLSSATGQSLRVVGWYHSHPHITWMPSHVDCRTQGTMQMLDQDFVGIIVSCFHSRSQNGATFDERERSLKSADRIQFTAFRAVHTDTGHSARYVPVAIVPSVAPSKVLVERIVEIPELLFKEEQDTMETACRQSGSPDVITLLHNVSVYTQALCSIMDIFAVPMLQSLEQYISEYERRIAGLRKEKKELEKRLAQEPPRRKAAAIRTVV